MDNKITSRPPQKTAQDFIMEAEKREAKQKTPYQKEIIYPWQEKHVRADVQKVFTVRLPEEYILKIKYISESTNKSQQQLVRDIINAGLKEILNDMGINQNT